MASLEDVADGCEIHEPDSKPFRLLDLPQELWSRVRRPAVTEDEPIHLDGESSISAFKAVVAQAPITKASREIRNDTLHVFYTNEWLYVDSGSTHSVSNLRLWLLALPHEYRNSVLEHLTIQSDYFQANHYFEGNLGVIGVKLNAVGELRVPIPYRVELVK